MNSKPLAVVFTLFAGTAWAQDSVTEILTHVYEMKKPGHNFVYEEIGAESGNHFIFTLPMEDDTPFDTEIFLTTYWGRPISVHVAGDGATAFRKSGKTVTAPPPQPLASASESPLLDAAKPVLAEACNQMKSFVECELSLGSAPTETIAVALFQWSGDMAIAWSADGKVYSATGRFDNKGRYSSDAQTKEEFREYLKRLGSLELGVDAESWFVSLGERGLWLCAVPAKAFRKFAGVDGTISANLRAGAKHIDSDYLQQIAAFDLKSAELADPLLTILRDLL